MPVLASMSSVNARISAIVFADDMESSLLFVERDCGEPSKGLRSVG